MRRTRTYAPDFFLVAALASGFVPVAARADQLPINIPATPVCVAGEEQTLRAMVPDGEGGAILAWTDRRSGTSKIYVQRLGPNGTPQWTTLGVLAASAAGTQYGVALASDGAGGAILAWTDERTGVGLHDVYAQRLGKDGARLWPAGGIPIATSGAYEGDATIAADGEGGVIIAWAESWSPTETGVYAQRVSADGTKLWQPLGTVLALAPGDQSDLAIASDGAGGAIVAWEDTRDKQPDVYVQRVTSAGTTAWATDGVLVRADARRDGNPALVALPGGGVVVAWERYDIPTADYDVFAKRIAPDGSAGWAEGSILLGGLPGNQYAPVLGADGADGVWVAWADRRSGAADIAVQRLAPDGALAFEPNGRILCAAAGQQIEPALLVDAEGAALVTWADYRAGDTDADVYGQRIDLAGSLLYDEDGIGLAVARFNQMRPRMVSGTDGVIHMGWSDQRHTTGPDVYALSTRPSVVDVGGPAVTGLLLAAPMPNPATGGTAVIDFALPRAANVVLSLHDVRGRRVAMLASGARPAGPQRERIALRDDAGVALAPGVYLIRLESEGEARSRRLAILP